MAAYHLFRLSRNIAALHDFHSPNTFQERVVKIRAGYVIAFQCPQDVPLVLMLTTHPTRDGDIIGDQTMQFSPGVKSRDFFDPFGNVFLHAIHVHWFQKMTVR